MNSGRSQSLSTRQGLAHTFCYMKYLGPGVYRRAWVHGNRKGMGVLEYEEYGIEIFISGYWWLTRWHKWKWMRSIGAESDVDRLWSSYNAINLGKGMLEYCQVKTGAYQAGSNNLKFKWILPKCKWKLALIKLAVINMKFKGIGKLPSLLFLLLLLIWLTSWLVLVYLIEEYWRCISVTVSKR